MPVLLDRKGKPRRPAAGPFALANQSVCVTANERLMGEIVEVHIQEGFDQSPDGLRYNSLTPSLGLDCQGGAYI
jgi:hypothetical protein